MEGFSINIYIINSPYPEPVIIIVNSRCLRESPCKLRNNNNNYLCSLFLYSSILEIFINAVSHVKEIVKENNT